MMNSFQNSKKIFDGFARAALMEKDLTQKIGQLKRTGQSLTIAAIVFQEDAGSNLYTRLKREAAVRVGINYQVHSFSLAQSGVEDQVIATIHQLNQDSTITGIIIQKPWQKTWLQARGGDKTDYNPWWRSLTEQLEPKKDVDGLHPDTLVAIQQGVWHQQGRVLPATCRAVLRILEEYLGADWVSRSPERSELPEQSNWRFLILGKSDILGLPLFYELENRGLDVQLLGTQDFSDRMASGQKLLDAQVIISATGKSGLITGDLVNDGVVLIDVGEPRPDVDVASLGNKPAFLTPVPGGVGPMTVVSLLENCVDLVAQNGSVDLVALTS